MLEGKTIGVVIPAYNEEDLIGQVLTTMPEFVDRMIVINDCSKDRTQAVVEQFAEQDARIVLVNHEQNRGVGQSVIDGYLKGMELGLDVLAVMDGDGQMDPDDLANVVGPVARGEVDYTKGNRLLEESVRDLMPRYRYLGNSLLTLLTKFATGYWHLLDPQCGYTAISRTALEHIPIENMLRRYCYCADILNMLNLSNFRACNVPVRPVYGREKSKIRLRTYIPTVTWLLNRLFWRRMYHKYLVRDFNPLVFFYLFSLANFVCVALPLAVHLIHRYFTAHRLPPASLIIFSLAMMMGLLSFFFAMSMDMEDNWPLRGPWLSHYRRRKTSTRRQG